MAARKHGPFSIGRTPIKARSFATAGCNNQSLLTTVKQLKTPR
ncbi:uncharacterized protein G2W53_018010 [Senna tora]|uniref:Uncharacterized protein n=1 Tax=Senna tora TaxID=362788 RepID=A0A834TUD0_9FABA|nr:uncharacterized protein G2W53_018010 [Senna tora]